MAAFLGSLVVVLLVIALLVWLARTSSRRPATGRRGSRDFDYYDSDFDGGGDDGGD